METQTKNSIVHWYLPLLLGILFISVGIWVFITPVASYLTLSILFSVTFFVSGIMEIIYAISSRKNLEGWGWSLAGGIIDFLIGTLLVTTPAISLVVLPLFIGFAILFRSAMAIGWSFEFKKLKLPNQSSSLFVGILGVLFAFILLWNPVITGLTIVIYTAMAFLVIGIYQVFLAFRLRKLNKWKKA